MSIRSLTTLAAIAAALVAPAAFAVDGVTPAGHELRSSSHATPQSKTRDQVVQEVLQARRDGTLDKMRGELTYAPEFQHPTDSVLTREQVKQQVLQARRDGTLDSMRGELTYAPEFQQPTDSVLAREQVRQAVLQAQNNGTLDRMRGEIGSAHAL